MSEKVVNHKPSFFYTHESKGLYLIGTRYKLALSSF